jgi:uncharacterized protein YyaL (SSP411 family)
VATSQTKFHFSPRPNRANEIRWREWGEDAFREAKETGKPVLLSLSAVWCHWCHVMDETSYSDEGVISFVNEYFIPVRVDNDQRPDVNARYNMGGWPTTAFLTPEGEILAGATYVPPDQMKELLPKVNVHWQSNKDEVVAKASELRQRRLTAMSGERGELSPGIFDEILRSVVENYDPVFGGFGEAPKFPHTDASDLLLYAYRKTRDPDLLHMARKTLEFMSRGDVFDQEWGGFFRYATRRDWSEPHYEKMLEDNAKLLENLLALHRTTGNDAHAETARRTVEYIEWKLRDKERGFFYGSQDADEEFYKLSKEGRERAQEPYVDRTCYVSWNAMMISAYLEAAWTLDPFDGAEGERVNLRERARAALEFLWSECRDADRGMYRFHDGSRPQVLGLLGDQAHTAKALLDAYEVTGDSTYLDRALELARFMLDRFVDRENGGFFDVWDEVQDVGRLKDRQKSIQDNTICAEVFLRLHHLTRDEDYRTITQGTLEAFVSAYPHMGYFAARYARQLDTLLNPPAEVNIVGAVSSASELQRAALALDVPSRVVQLLDPRRDASRLEGLSLPAEPAPAAYACVGTMCSAPVTAADAIAEAVREMQQAAARPA